MNSNLLVTHVFVTKGLSSIAPAARRRLVFSAMLCAVLWIFHAPAHGAGLKSIAILDFDLVDDQRELAPATVEYQRLRAIRDQLQQELDNSLLICAES